GGADRPPQWRLPDRPPGPLALRGHPHDGGRRGVALGTVTPDAGAAHTALAALALLCHRGSMTAEPLDDLLARLSAGDPDAAEQAFRTYEPYLRGLVRRHLSRSLRTKVDPVDII